MARQRRVFSTEFKREAASLIMRLFKTRKEAKLTIFEYIEVFYNRVRLHSSNEHMSPVDYESALLAAA